MMTGLQDIHSEERASPGVCSEGLSLCTLTDLNRVTLQLHACIAWVYGPDSREYVLLLLVFSI